MDPFCLATYPFVIGYLTAVRAMEAARTVVEFWDTPNRLIFSHFCAQTFRPTTPV